MSDSSFPQKILIVDADKSIAQGIRGPLEKQGIKIDAASDLGTALYMFNQSKYPVVLIDLAFEELPGLVLAQRWRGHESSDKAATGMIMMSGNAKGQKATDDRLIEEIDGLEVIYKPLNPIHILPQLKKAMANRVRRLKYTEVSQEATKLAKNPKTIGAALELAKANAKDLGMQGQNLIREILEIQEQWQPALDVVEGVLQQLPSNISALNNKGRLLLKLNQLDEALKVMELADKQAPNNIQRINELALAYLQAKKPGLSVEKMKELIGFHPDQPEMKFDMFAKLQAFGYDDYAINLCKDTTSPLEVIRHYNNKGVALAKAGNVDAAILEYERALKYFPKYRENYRILYNIALAHLTYKTREHYEIALEYVGKCLELNPRFEKGLKVKEQLNERLARKSAS